ncbi:MAG: YaiO family outer membrane beta-barrel protein [Polaromonas sp.]|uniref:YaiO family outer membrane beta-barrel protein n=1 Tax=Polaromonas sp. TaxID=1869339 RepID=UPI00273514E9|nr:YaiO family outer membrane beta-barrel protein [Polaromonas sp.]MDP2818758.1 YaiO family outer membrane beta-barrel protein [Polaromonas sp.]
MIRISPVVALLGLLLPMATAFAQTQTQPAAPSRVGVMPAQPAPNGAPMQRNLELSAGGQNLSGGFGNWRDVTLRGTYGLPSHVLQGELSQNHRFGVDGTFVGLSDTYTFNEDWHGSVAVGVGDGAFYLPKFRVDATLYRKFLQGRNLVGSVGVGYYDAPTGYTDRSVSLGATYYFEAPWIVEGGVRMNTSNPGSVKSQQQFVALTYGRPKQNLVTGRYGWGSEGYLAVATGAQLVNFNSREASLTWRHWVNPNTGVLVGVNRYINPSYRRSGAMVGIFHDF